MLATDRHNVILDILAKEGSVRNSELVKILQVSLETIRRDLEYLSKEGLVQKVHGGAIKVDDTPNNSYFSRMTTNVSEKVELASIAINYIQNGDTIALNSSTTNLELVKLIKARNLKVTLITNSILIAEEVQTDKNIHLILAGGVFKREELAFIGPITAEFLSQFSVNKCFLSVGGISLKKGITDFYVDEVVVEKQLWNISKEVFVVADSSKFEHDSLFSICELDKIDFIITDSKLDSDIKTQYSKENIQIINS